MIRDFYSRVEFYNKHYGANSSAKFETKMLPHIWVTKFA